MVDGLQILTHIMEWNHVMLSEAIWGVDLSKRLFTLNGKLGWIIIKTDIIQVQLEPMILLGYLQEYRQGVAYRNKNDSKAAAMPEPTPA